MKKYNCVMQDDFKDCGICSLLTIIRHYKGNVSKEYLRSITGTNKFGVNALSLIEAGKRLGFDAKGVNGDIRKLDKKFLPCIAHIILDKKTKHFVVIHDIDLKNENIVIADPSRGIIKMDLDMFDGISTKNYLILIPIKKIPYYEEHNLIKNEIIHFIYKYNNEFITLLCFSLLYTIFSILITYNLKFIIEIAIVNNSLKNLHVVILFLAFIYFIKTILDYFRIKILNFINHKLDYLLLSKSFYHILSLPHLYFKDRTTGDVFSRIRDTVEIREILSSFIITIFIDFLVAIVSLIALLSISKKLTIITFIIILIYSIFSYFYNKYLSLFIEDLKVKNSSINSKIIEYINGNNSIKSLNILEKIKMNFSNVYNRFLISNYNYIEKENKKYLFEQIINNVLIIIVLLIGSKMVINNDLKLSSLITFNTILFYFYEPLKRLLSFNLIYKKARLIIERLNEMLNLKEEKTNTNLLDIKNIKGDIDIKNLYYKYGSRNLFSRFNLTIKEGEKVLIYGKSGCGKSTLGKIIGGIIPIERGKIKIGREDINNYNLWNLREQVTYIFQDEYIFNDSLIDNIKIKKTRDNGIVKELIGDMMLEEVINKRDSELILEENASNISGGERQRLILARAFTKNSNIYILDESFSQIDIETEKEILTNLFIKYRYKTIIVISHRFNNNDLYDRVIDLEKYGYK